MAIENAICITVILALIATYIFIFWKVKTLNRNIKNCLDSASLTTIDPNEFDEELKDLRLSDGAFLRKYPGGLDR